MLGRAERRDCHRSRYSRRRQAPTAPEPLQPLPPAPGAARQVPAT